MNRSQRRAFARTAPPRLCEWCGVALGRFVSVDAHLARHLEAQYGISRHAGRRVARYEDGLPLPRVAG